MIQYVATCNVGPASEMELEFGERLNLFTGDNGLGKSFLLDIVWWSLTRKWPAEVNTLLTVGKKALPAGEGNASISFSFAGSGADERYESVYSRRDQAWTGRPGRPSNPGLVLYALSDGSFALWDPARNYWRRRGGIDVQDRRPAYVFNPAEVWDGLLSPEGSWICNGLIRDWAGWQKEKGVPFELLKEVLQILSPSDKERLEPGDLTRIDLDDSRDIPTIRMPYRQDVPVVHASSGIRRILALAYFLVWAWEEHKQAAKQLQEPETGQIVFLIDEIESHLHPSWQRALLPALLSVAGAFSQIAETQILAATHSPIVMASVEPIFDDARDAWFDLDFEKENVLLRRRDFEKRGDASSWLLSEAFDLKSDRALEYERLVDEAAAMLEADSPNIDAIREMNERLVHAMGPSDGANTDGA